MPQVKAVHTEKPTFFIYDSYPGGIGLSEKISTEWEALIEEAALHIESCYCQAGCPICIGAQESEKNMKKDVQSLLNVLIKGKTRI